MLQAVTRFSSKHLTGPQSSSPKDWRDKALRFQQKCHHLRETSLCRLKSWDNNWCSKTISYRLWSQHWRRQGISQLSMSSTQRPTRRSPLLSGPSLLQLDRTCPTKTFTGSGSDRQFKSRWTPVCPKISTRAQVHFRQQCLYHLKRPELRYLFLTKATNSKHQMLLNNNLIQRELPQLAPKVIINITPHPHTSTMTCSMILR